MDANEFLEKVYLLCEQNKKELAADLVMDYFYELNQEPIDFSRHEDVFKRIDIQKLPPAFFGIFLVLTYDDKDLIPSRARFWQLAYDEFVELEGKIIADRLIAHIK